MQNSINVFGCTIYLMLMILFLWVSYVPGTKSGPGWWCMALLFALLSRLSLFYIAPTLQNEVSAVLYFALGAIEKPLLILGLIRFLDLNRSIVAIWFIAAFLEIWFFSVWFFDLSIWLLRPLGAAFFCLTMLYVSIICFKNRRAFPGGVMYGISFFSLAFSINWMLAYPIFAHYPGWGAFVLIITSVSKMGLYLFLLAGVFLSFKARLERAEAEALHLAYYDALTGMNNKLYLDGIFDYMVSSAERSGTLLAVIFIDLDDFKPINDSAGHEVGDKVLAKVAKRITGCVRATDVCARLGGDEFVILAAHLDKPEQSVLLAEKLIKNISRNIRIASKDYRVGVSVGISLYPLHGQDLSTLMALSDKAMYEVKKRGKMSVSLYNGGEA
ncbi:diguanylate cyclase domain-containing protein [Vreelandella sp. TE19]